MSHSDLIAERARLLMKKGEDEEIAAQKIAESRWKTAARWNAEHRATLSDTEHPPGTLVLIRNTAVEKELNRKHKPRWLGPMVVVRRTEGGAYICAELSGVVSSLRFAQFRVKKFVSRDGLSFDVGDWLGKEKLADVESQLLNEEAEIQAWSLPNGDEDSEEDEKEEVPDGVYEEDMERGAYRRQLVTEVGPKHLFDGVHLPRIPNLPKFSLKDLGPSPESVGEGEDDV
jgi:hypothetical protein